MSRWRWGMVAGGLAALLALAGCVSTARYRAEVRRRTALARQLALARQDIARLRTYAQILRDQVAQLQPAPGAAPPRPGPSPRPVGALDLQPSAAFLLAQDIKRHACACGNYQCYRAITARRISAWRGELRFRDGAERMASKVAILAADQCLRTLSRRFWRRDIRGAIGRLRTTDLGEPHRGERPGRPPRARARVRPQPRAQPRPRSPPRPRTAPPRPRFTLPVMPK